MVDEPHAVKRCTEQHLGRGQPSSEWLPEELMAYVRAQQQSIEDDEHRVAVKYWRMGRALNLLRRTFNHGQWEQFLRDVNLDKSKASRSRAIARTFTDEHELAGLTVKEAYAKRSRRSPAPTASAPSPAQREQRRLAKFFQDVAREADSMLDEAGFIEHAVAGKLLSAAEAALGQMQKLYDLLRQQAGGD